jgi:hypothetical protein
MNPKKGNYVLLGLILDLSGSIFSCCRRFIPGLEKSFF